MIEVEDVWRLIDEGCAARPGRRVPLADALGTTLAEDAVADADAPPFDRATMDGYAVRRDDAGESFAVVATIAPGDFGGRAPDRGEAVRILTGAAVPAPGLQVIMQEEAVREGNRLRFIRRGGETNICKRGEDVRAGATLLPAGTRLGPAELALLASIGEATPRVVRPGRILHFTSGNEIVPVEEIPGSGRIRNTNATLIRALAAAFPVKNVCPAHLPDDEAEANALIDAAGLEGFDVVLFSGGASVGDHDHTRNYLERRGFEIRCSAVNVRPGKPLIFATANGGRIAFGLPGNPVSHFVCFHLFVARALARLTGLAPCESRPAELMEPIPGALNRRVTFWPARLAGGGVRPVPWNSSGHLASLRGVDALIRLPANAELPKVGTNVQIWPLEQR